MRVSKGPEGAASASLRTTDGMSVPCLICSLNCRICSTIPEVNETSPALHECQKRCAAAALCTTVQQRSRPVSRYLNLMKSTTGDMLGHGESSPCCKPHQTARLPACPWHGKSRAGHRDEQIRSLQTWEFFTGCWHLPAAKVWSLQPQA